MNYLEIVKDLLGFKEYIKEFKAYNNSIYNLSLFKFFFKWHFFKTQTDTLKFNTPWITFPAIKYLDKYIKKNMKVFEYGCGGSTLFFADRANEVISVEHDKSWFKKLSEHIKILNNTNVKLKNIEPSYEQSLEKIYSSANENYTGQSFKNYVLEISGYPDNYFDVVLIDGRARVGCFLHSIPKLKKGGILVWDNTERSRYRENFNIQTHGLKKIEVPGPTPFSRFFTLTTIFIKE